MKYIRMLLAVLTGSLVFLGIVPGVTAGPTNTTYRVKVVSSFGTTFTDCYRFDTPGIGDLSIDLLGQVITYRHGQLNTKEERFKAVARSGQALAIMFFGETFDPLDQLTGEAVSEFGDTFLFSGPSDAACVPGTSSTNPYLKPPPEVAARTAGQDKTGTPCKPPVNFVNFEPSAGGLFRPRSACQVISASSLVRARSVPRIRT